MRASTLLAPPVREPFSFDEKVGFYRDLGFVGIQFHDDDIVPDIDAKTHTQLIARTKAVKTQLDDQGLTAEVVAPRLWESPQTIDGAYTANNPKGTPICYRTFKTVCGYCE